MPGPGGGARGGGGSRGGFSGGSRGGGFGGPRGGFGGGGHTPPPPGGHFGGWHHRPRRHYGGGGGSGCCGVVFAPVIVILIAVFLIFSFVGSMFSGTSSVEVITYDENTFQDYADACYAEEFGSSDAYEDNLLLVFLAEEDVYYDYYYIAWVGDHIETDINYMFGDESTELGQAIAECVNESSYKYSLDSNLAEVIKTMEQHIVSQGLTSSFNCEEDHIQVRSHLTNKTNMELTEDTVNAALQSFTDTTGIPIVIVVDDIDDVFGEEVSFGSDSKSEPGEESTPAIAAGLVVVAIIVFAVLIIRSKRKNRKPEKEPEPWDDAFNGDN